MSCVTVAAEVDPFDFTLATLDGSQFVRLAKVQRPTLINFWGVECPPCVAELPRLEHFAKQNPAWTILLVSTDTLNATQDFLGRHPISLTVLKPGNDVTRLMRLAGNRIGVLPFSVALDHDNKICFRKLGELKADDFIQLTKSCR